MSETADLPALLPALPEIVLAVGAMALLMLGAFPRRARRRRRSIGSRSCCWWPPAPSSCGCPTGRLVTFGGSFVVDGFARFLKLLALTGSACAILMSLDYLAAREAAANSNTRS